MRRRDLFAGLLATLLAASPAAATTHLNALLDGLLPPQTPQGRVEVTARIEPAGEHFRLVVELRPLGDAKLVADPGSVLRAEAAEGITWLEPETKALEPGRIYFDGPITLALPFRADGPGEVRARLDYAWCLVGFQCLFGEERVRLPLTTVPAG